MAGCCFTVGLCSWRIFSEGKCFQRVMTQCLQDPEQTSSRVASLAFLFQPIGFNSGLQKLFQSNSSGVEPCLTSWLVKILVAFNSEVKISTFHFHLIKLYENSALYCFYWRLGAKICGDVQRSHVEIQLIGSWTSMDTPLSNNISKHHMTHDVKRGRASSDVGLFTEMSLHASFVPLCVCISCMVNSLLKPK